MTSSNDRHISGGDFCLLTCRDPRGGAQSKGAPTGIQGQRRLTVTHPMSFFPVGFPGTGYSDLRQEGSLFTARPGIFTPSQRGAFNTMRSFSFKHSAPTVMFPYRIHLILSNAITKYK